MDNVEVANPIFVLMPSLTSRENEVPHSLLLTFISTQPFCNGRYQFSLVYALIGTKVGYHH